MLSLLLNPNKMLVRQILVKPLSFLQAPDVWQQTASPKSGLASGSMFSDLPFHPTSPHTFFLAQLIPSY